MLKKFGALPFIAVALLAGAFMAGQHSARRGTPPAAKGAAGPASPGLLGSLFQSAGSNGTQARLYEPGAPFDPNATLGECGYCHSTLSITGNKGRDNVRCPNCGGEFTALKAIMYFNYQLQRVR